MRGRWGYVQSGFLGGNIGGFFSDTWDRDMEFIQVVKAESADSDGFFGLHSAATTIPTTARHIGFYYDGTTLYATSSDGTTQETTDISAGLTLTNNNALRFVWDNGTSIKYYVNDVLVATHTTKIPAGVTTPPKIHAVAVYVNASREFIIKNADCLTYDL